MMNSFKDYLLISGCIIILIITSPLLILILVVEKLINILFKRKFEYFGVKFSPKDIDLFNNEIEEYIKKNNSNIEDTFKYSFLHIDMDYNNKSIKTSLNECPIYGKIKKDTNGIYYMEIK